MKYVLYTKCALPGLIFISSYFFLTGPKDRKAVETKAALIHLVLVVGPHPLEFLSTSDDYLEPGTAALTPAMHAGQGIVLGAHQTCLTNWLICIEQGHQYMPQTWQPHLFEAVTKKGPELAGDDVMLDLGTHTVL